MTDPTVPEDLNDGELTEDVLDEVAGGFISGAVGGSTFGNSSGIAPPGTM